MIQLPQDIQHLFQGGPVYLAIQRYRQAAPPANLYTPRFPGVGDGENEASSTGTKPAIAPRSSCLRQV